MKTKKGDIREELTNVNDFYNLATFEELLEDDEVGPMEEAFMRGYINTEGSI